MYEQLMEINTKIVDIYEHRDVRQILDPSGAIIGLEPVRGSERVYLTLELPGGVKIMAEVSNRDYVGYVVPILKTPGVP